MFGFGKTARDPLSDAKSAERWFAAQPAGDPLAIHAELMGALGAIAERGRARAPAMLEAVFRADTLAQPLRESLTTQYIEHASRSSRIEHQLWSAMFDMTQAFLLAYAAFSHDVSDHAQSGKWQALLPELIARQIVHLGLEAKIRLYRYEQWIPAKWAELHSLFSLACSRKIERHPVGGEGPHASTIEHAYLTVLVLQLMNAGNLTARHLEWVAGELDEWCAPLRLTLEPSSVSSFYVDLGTREGLKRRTTPAPLEGRVLFLDTRPLHAMLMQNVVVIEQKIRHQPLSDRTPRRSEQLALLTKLASQVDPEFRPFARRGERTAAVGVVDAIVGFSKIAGFLHEEERDPLPRVESGKSFGGTMELAVFGQARNVDDRRRELARRRLSTWGASGGPWEVKDISQTGFRLVAPMSAASAVTLNTLAAIRPYGHAFWTLGIVRRMRRLTSDRAEIGLQVIANTLIGVELCEQKRGNGESGYSVEGENSTLDGRVFAGLFLALRKRERETAVQSLIVPAVEYQPARRFRLNTARQTVPIRFGRLIEQQPDWVWAAVEPIDLGDGETLSPVTVAPGFGRG